MTYNEFIYQIIPFKVSFGGETYTIVKIPQKGIGIQKDGEASVYKVQPTQYGLSILDSDGITTKEMQFVKWDNITVVR